MNRREQYLELLGLDVWQLRRPAAPSPASAEPPQPTAPAGPPVAAGPLDEPAGEGAEVRESDAVWERLREEVAACTRCALCGSRTQTVFGVGNRQAQLLVIGEAPGAEEDRQGEPFVGRAGQLLNSMLRAIGCARESVYIANVLKCRPPGNRDPSPTEVAACLPYLQRQIELLAPRLILVVGRIAAQNLLATEAPIGASARAACTGSDRGDAADRDLSSGLPAAQSRRERRAWTDLKLARLQLRRALEEDSGQEGPRQGAARLTVADGAAGARRGGLGGQASLDGANSA